MTWYNSFSFARTVANTLLPTSVAIVSIQCTRTVIREDMIYRVLCCVVGFFFRLFVRPCPSRVRRRGRGKKCTYTAHGMGSMRVCMTYTYISEKQFWVKTQTGANLSSVPIAYVQRGWHANNPNGVVKRGFR